MSMTDQNLNNLYLWNNDSIGAALNILIPQALNVSRISIDSRHIEPYDMFIALKGENHNGNHFALNAIKSGASVAIIDEDIEGLENYTSKIIKVDDALEALNKLAEYNRKRSQAKIIAVTGSAGKTTTKEMLRLAFATMGQVYASHGNFNNHFGLPLCLSNMPIDIKYGVFELGMNHQGEIRHLTQLAKPDAVIITTIEAAHLEFFDSVESIAKAKAEIFEGMLKGGFAIINYDNQYHPILIKKAEEKKLKILSYGSHKEFEYILNDYYVMDSATANISITASGLNYNYILKAIGKHIAMNSLAILAAVECMGGDIAVAAKALGKFESLKGRGRLIKNITNITIIDDCYNANPASVKVALESLKTLAENHRSIAVLGDMKELGISAKKLHEDLKNDILANNISKVFCVGEMMLHLYNFLPPAIQGAYCQNAKQMAIEIKKYLFKDDVVLIKGSNSMKMDEIVNALI